MPDTAFTIYEIYLTQNDDRVCPTCAPYHGKVFRRGNGPQPPLHPGCRCRRVYHHAEPRAVDLPPFLIDDDTRKERG